MEWLDSFELLSDESFNPFHFSPPRLDLEPKTIENTKQAENVPIDVESTSTFDDQWIIEQNKQPENGSQLVESNDPMSEWILEDNRHGEWTSEENKAFENALAEVDPLSPTFIEDVASRVPNKSTLDIKTHYEDLVCDVEMIESGLIEPPEYLDHEYDEDSSSTDLERDGSEPRRRGPGWTEEEHKLFLKGLAKYGKGDWKSISRHCLVNRTPSQIASHAQKFYQRMQTNDCTSDFPLRPRRRSIHDIRNLPPTTTTTGPSLLLKSTPGQTSTDQQTVSPLVPLNNMINASNSTRKRSRGLLDYGGSSSGPTITSSTTTSFPPPRGRPRHKNHQLNEKALPPARNSFTVDNIVNAINNQKAGSHGVLGYHNSSFPSLGTTGGTTTSFQSLKPKNHQETEQALRPHKSISIGNMADAGNNHKQSHGFLNDHHGSTFLPPITTTTTTTISYPSAKLKNPIQSAHSHEALLPQTSFSYNTNRINANNRLERREHFLDYHGSTFPQPMASRSSTFPIAGNSTTIQQQYSTPFPSSSSFTPRMTSTTFPMAGTTAINQQYSTAFPSSSSFTPPIASTAFPMAGSSRKIAFPPSFSFTPPMTSTTFPMAGRSSTTINHQYSTAFPTSSSYTPPLTSTTFPRAGPLSRLTQQYSNASPSSSLLTPPTTTTISMAGRTTINQQSSGTVLPSSSSLLDPSKNWYSM